MPTLDVTLPRPHALQTDILASRAKRKVACTGRRSGKTTVAAITGVHYLLAGKKVLITSATQDQADAFWDKIKTWLATLFQAGVATKNEGRRIIDMVNSGRIRVKTGSNPDALRGDDADLVILDECALLDPEAWYEVAAPMLADRDGDAIFLSTPRGRNWFYHLYQRAAADDTGRWAAWHFATTLNPHLSASAVEELAGDMTETAYRQEILAEFLENEGQVFRKIDERSILKPRNPYPGKFACGLDWAMENDYTVITVVDAVTKHQVAMDRFNGVDWALQRGRLAAMMERWQPEVVIAEHNSIGGPNIEALQREGWPIVPFTTTAKSKPPLIEALVLALERGDLDLLDDAVQRAELEAYERHTNAYTGHTRYGAPDSLHDDTVMALALAWHGVHRRKRRAVVL